MPETSTKPTQAEWSDVDKAGDTAAFKRYLDAIRENDATSAYKRLSVELLGLAPGQRGLDAGCGTGEDARRMAEAVGPGGHVWGIDFSAAMVDESTKRWAGANLAFEVGDVHALRFETASFDAARSDRVFQHLADPVGALRELVRVVKPGGRIAISDPDWGTYFVDGPRSPTMRAYLDFASGQARNPWIGRQLFGMFVQAGMTDVSVAAHTLFFRDYHVLEKLGNLDAGFVAAVAAGAMTPAQVDEVKAQMQGANAEGRFLAGATILTVGGTTRSR